MGGTTELRMPGTPRPWMNRAMRLAMRLPGLGRLLGRSFAVITVKGARSGRRYSTPVQYMLVDGDYVVLSQQHRTWWRNVRTKPGVRLDIAGSTVHGRARVPEGTDASATLGTCLAGNPRVARFYGLEPTDDGSFRPDDVARLAEHVVPLVITPDD